MAISTDKIKKTKKDPNPEREPAKKIPSMKPFRKGLKSPTYGRRNPHKDHGDKKPSLKTKASIIKDKAKKGQGLAKGGIIKSIIRIPPLPSPSPMPRSGVISTIDKGIRKPRPAEKFVKIRERINKLGGYAMGGQASESVARSKILKEQRDRKRKKLLDSINRTPGGANNPKNKGMMLGEQLRDYIERNPGRMTNRILNLARSRKPTGRLNIDDFMNAKMSGVLAGADPFSKTGSSKGPAGKVKKKKK